MEWTAGWIAVATWTQSWKVVRRGHFRIVAWCTAVIAAMAAFANRAAINVADAGSGAQDELVIVLAAGAVLLLAVQYSRTEVPAVVIGVAAAGVGLAALIATGALLAGWSWWLGAMELIAGATLLGAVTNGMLLGHWYLNQPGLQPWALARLTQLGLIAAALTGVLGLVAAGRLSSAETQGAVLGLPGFGASFGLAFFAIWVLLIGFTAGVVWMARRCITLRSIQSATGLYYVALLTAGVSEFLVRYLMVNAA